MSFVKVQFWALTTAVLFLAAASANAATITWISSGIDTGPGDVSLNGSLTAAVQLGGPTQTLNDVVFATDPGTNSFTQGPITFNMPYVVNIANNGYSSQAGAYGSELDDARIGNTTPVTFTLSGMTSGQLYEVQIWYNDERNGNHAGVGLRTNTFTAGNAVTLTAFDTPNPQWAIGSFTADALPLSITNTTSAGAAVQLHLIQLRAVPEPTSFAMLLFGSIGLLLMRRKQTR